MSERVGGLAPRWWYRVAMVRAGIVLSALLAIACDGARETADATVSRAREAVTPAPEAQERKTGVRDAPPPAPDVKAEPATDGEDSSGSLSGTARAWLEAGSDAAGRSIEAVVSTGTQLAPVALEVGAVLNDAVDREITIEPVYQKLDDDEATARTDAAIGEMPRVEVVDGLKIGFKSLSETDVHKHRKERGYLVLWRQDDHLIGFVYRTRREIDLEKLVAETPRLVGLIRSTLESE